MDNMPTATIVPLNVDHHKSMAPHDYSYADHFTATDRAEHFKQLKRHFLASPDVVRSLTGWLLHQLEAHITPIRFHLREFTAGDTYLMMRVLFHTRTLHTSVRLNMRNNALNRTAQNLPPEAELIERFEQYRDSQGNAVTMKRASSFARGLHALFVQHGLSPIQTVRDHRTVTITYEWQHDGQIYDVFLTTRLDTQRPYLDLVYVDE